MVERAPLAAEEKAYELSGVLDVIMGLSKELSGKLKKIDASCGSALPNSHTQ
jgi:hypothetical protein